MSTAKHTALSVGCANGTLRRFTWTDDHFVLTSKVTAHDGGIDHVAFWNHNGRAMEITGGRDGAVRFWQALVNDSLTDPVPQMRRNTHVLAKANTGTLLLGPDHDGRLCGWDVATGASLGPLTGLSEHVWQTMTLCRIGDRSAVIVEYNGRATILDLNGGTLIDAFTVSGPRVSALQVVASPGSPVLVCATEDGAISCYDLDQSRWITRGSRLHESKFELDTIHLDGRRTAVTLGRDIKDSHAVLRLWDIDAGTIATETLATLDLDDMIGPTANDFGPFAAGHVDGQAIAVWMGGGSAVRVWDLRSGALIKTGFVEDGHQMALHEVAIGRLHDHDVIISGGYAGALSIWNLSGSIRAVIEFGQITSACHILPPDSLIVGGSMGILKLSLTPGFLIGEEAPREGV
jgi:WD40 repeat protein